MIVQYLFHLMKNFYFDNDINREVQLKIRFLLDSYSLKYK
jgi:hypothetical protein